MLERDVFFFEVIENVAVVFRVEAEEHFGVVQITRVLDRLAHAVEYALVELNFINF